MYAGYANFRHGSIKKRSAVSDAPFSLVLLLLLLQFALYAFDAYAAQQV